MFWVKTLNQDLRTFDSPIIYQLLPHPFPHLFILILSRNAGSRLYKTNHPFASTDAAWLYSSSSLVFAAVNIHGRMINFLNKVWCHQPSFWYQLRISKSPNKSWSGRHLSSINTPIKCYSDAVVYFINCCLYFSYFRCLYFSNEYS